MNGVTMRIQKIILRKFRNYQDSSILVDKTLNIFIGENAQGKTNILESIHLSSLGRSHRTHDDEDLIHWNYPDSCVEIYFIRGETEHKLAIHLHRIGKRGVFLNDHPIRSYELIGLLNTVIFSPEDLFLIKGTPSGRRRFMDSEISQANPVYFKELLKYNRILMQRNQLLKKIRERSQTADLLETWDEQFAPVAASVVVKRIEALKKLTMLANLIHRRITSNKENLMISYSQHEGLLSENNSSPVINDIKKWFQKQLIEHRQEDIFKGNTGIGPHRDDIVLSVNGINLRNYGSQGQQRTGILALKLAEIEFIKSETGEYPVLLLDDVLSELDSMRRGQLLGYIQDRIQTFITATDAENFVDRKTGKYFTVNNGSVME
ncbi:MAG: replication and repair protein recF [Firmicutes bacterium]|nr:replication and repair protein recF [Bacillota bacterium]